MFVALNLEAPFKDTVGCTLLLVLQWHCTSFLAVGTYPTCGYSCDKRACNGNSCNVGELDLPGVYFVDNVVRNHDYEHQSGQGRLLAEESISIWTES